MTCAILKFFEFWDSYIFQVFENALEKIPVGDAVGDAVADAVVGGAVGEAVGDAVGEAVGDAVGEAVGDAVGEAVVRNVNFLRVFKRNKKWINFSEHSLLQCVHVCYAYHKAI